MDIAGFENALRKDEHGHPFDVLALTRTYAAGQVFTMAADRVCATSSDAGAAAPANP